MINESQSVVGRPRNGNDVVRQGWIGPLLPLLPLFGVAVFQVGLYAWAARRGFDYTDEAFYLVSYLHWADAVAVFTFFGAFIEWPFRLLNQDVAAIRLFSLVLMMGSSAAFISFALRFLPGERLPKPLQSAIVLAAACSSLYYFGYFTTLRAPSYNLLALAAMLLSTGLLMGFSKCDFPSSRSSWPKLLYGVVIASCMLNKVSTGGLLVLCHAMFFLAVNEDWSMRRIGKCLGLSLVGFTLPILTLQLLHPGWLAAFREGLVWAKTNDPSYGIMVLLNNFRWDLQRQLWSVWPWALGVLLLGGLLGNLFRIGRFAPASFLVSSIVLSGVAIFIQDDWREHWWLSSVAIVASLFLAGRFQLPKGDRSGPVRSTIALLFLLLALPLVFSFGTNGRLLAHSFAAAVFVVSAIMLLLVQLHRQYLIGRSVLLVGLTALATPPLIFQVRTLVDVDQTYRQLAPLVHQGWQVPIGPADRTLMVTEEVRTELLRLMEATKSAGFRAGGLMHDFTGDGSGLLYVLGARPLLTAWTGGGYPGSEAAAARLLSKASDADLRSSWLLTSEDNPRAIMGWPEMLSRRLGDAESHELVATVRMRATYRWGVSPPDYHHVMVWKPRAQGETAEGEDGR